MHIFEAGKFTFPYHDLRFPGQYSEERILFVTREGNIILKTKLVVLGIIVLLGLMLGFVILSNASLMTFTFAWLIPPFTAIWLLMGIFAGWWIISVWQKTVFIITTRRLTKFIHTTPWTRYQLSLGLDMIVDTGAYQKGAFQMFTGLGYFVARSAAGAVKNFKIVNIGFAEDLHNYVNKLLYVMREQPQKLEAFRPFIPHLKGEARDEYVRRIAPQYGKPKQLPQETVHGN